LSFYSLFARYFSNLASYSFCLGESYTGDSSCLFDFLPLEADLEFKGEGLVFELGELFLAKMEVGGLDEDPLDFPSILYLFLGAPKD
jgi:hypothetical protein